MRSRHGPDRSSSTAVSVPCKCSRVPLEELSSVTDPSETAKPRRSAGVGTPLADSAWPTPASEPTRSPWPHCRRIGFRSAAEAICTALLEPPAPNNSCAALNTSRWFQTAAHRMRTPFAQWDPAFSDARSTSDQGWSAVGSPPPTMPIAGVTNCMGDSVDGSRTAEPSWCASDVWVGVAVDGASELAPRQALTVVPEALSADIARRLRVADASGACDDGEIVWNTARGNLSVCQGEIWRSVGTAILTEINGSRSWSNGRYTKSCTEYRSPPPGVLYEGSTRRRDPSHGARRTRAGWTSLRQ
jgi:hypothetical protein